MNDALLEGYFAGYLEKTAGPVEKLPAMSNGKFKMDGSGLITNLKPLPHWWRPQPRQNPSYTNVPHVADTAHKIVKGIYNQSPLETKLRQAADDSLDVLSKNHKSIDPVVGRLANEKLDIRPNLEQIRGRKNNALSHVDQLRGNLRKLNGSAGELDERINESAHELLPKKYNFKNVMDKITGFRARKNANSISDAYQRRQADERVLTHNINDAADNFLTAPAIKGRPEHLERYVGERQDRGRKAIAPYVKRVENVQKAVKANRPGLENTYDELKNIFNRFK